MTEMDKQQQEIIRSIEEKIAELKEIKQLLVKCQRDFECASLERDMLRKQNDRLLVSLKECASELCQKCSKKKNSMLGACINCKWQNVRDWEVD